MCLFLLKSSLKRHFQSQEIEIQKILAEKFCEINMNFEKKINGTFV